MISNAVSIVRIIFMRFNALVWIEIDVQPTNCFDVPLWAVEQSQWNVFNQFHHITLIIMKSLNNIDMKYNYASVLSVYKPVLILLQITGFDFKLFKIEPAFKIIIKIYYICLLSCTLYISVICFILNLTYHVWTVLEYSISIIILLFYKSRLTKFFSEMSKIDVYLRVHRKHYIEHKNRTYIYIIFLWIVRFIYCIFYFTMISFPRNIFFYIILHLSSFALDLNRVWRFILLDTIRNRLKLLRMRLEEDPACNYYLYFKDKRSHKEDKIKFSLHLYRRIADMVDLITPELLNGSVRECF